MTLKRHALFPLFFLKKPLYPEWLAQCLAQSRNKWLFVEWMDTVREGWLPRQAWGWVSSTGQRTLSVRGWASTSPLEELGVRTQAVCRPGEARVVGHLPNWVWDKKGQHVRKPAVRTESSEPGRAQWLGEKREGKDLVLLASHTMCDRRGGA